MVFLRSKKISNGVYYYLVRSVKVKGKVRQKVVRYIGKQENLVSLVKNAKKK